MSSSRFLAAALALLALTACTQDRDVLPTTAVEGFIKQAPVRTATTAVQPLPRAQGTLKVGTASISVSLKLPDRALLAVVEDVARVTLTLREEGSGAVGSQELTRAQLAAKSASVRFGELAAGRFTLDVTAWDDQGANIGSASSQVQVAEGASATLSVRLQLVAGARNVATPRPVVAVPLPVATPATPAPVATPTPTPSPTATPTPAPTATPTPSPSPGLDFNGIMAEGVTRGLVYKSQQRLLMPAIAALAPADKVALEAALTAASATERIFILKALAAGESWPLVSAYAADIKGMPEALLISKSTMRDDLDLAQQWQDSCGPSIVQVAGGEYDPRYAFELNRLYKLDKVDPTGLNKTLADQQKDWLEAYGGVAVPRGQDGGKAIAITTLLNDKLGPITKASYQAIDTGADFEGSLEAVATALNDGYAVPLRVLFVDSGYGHFIVALESRGGRGMHDFLIHDSVSARTAWVSQASIRDRDFTVFFPQTASLSHYYRPTPR
jgi:hypothetical protein